MTQESQHFSQQRRNMDVRVQSDSKIVLKVLVIVIFIASSFLIWWLVQPPRLKADELLFSEVQHGTYQNKIQVAGQFKPLQQFWLVAPAEGVLTSLMIKPGSILQPGQLLATMTSQTLEQDIRKLQSSYAQAEAEYKAQQAQSEIEYSAAEIALLHSKHQAETSQLDVDTNKALVENGIVSRLQFEKMTKTALQHQLTLQVEKDRLQVIKRLQEAKLEAIRVKNQQIANELQELNRIQDSLQIRASDVGIVTQLAENLTPGQTLTAGSPIAQFADSNNLYAELYVPAMFASSLQHGLIVTLSLRSGTVQGEINRIDPRVINDRITVDVVLTQPMPAEARADLAVRADILISERTNSVFVQRPFYVQADRHQSVFVQDADGLSIYKKEVEFGAISGNQIEVLSGIVPGDRLLLTEIDPKMFQNSRIVLESLH